jgi:ABC-type dipeptide/oligopeptide/nickel transport system ATPase component
MKLIEEISENWKVEAKHEDNKYFYLVDESSDILNGKRFYVIGRKGSGKSAISEYITKLAKDDFFTEKLSFKNFPFNSLYNLDNELYTPPNQFITIWKYIIYSYICRMMAKNNKISTEVRKILEKLYPPNELTSIRRSVDKWVAKEFGAQIMGTGANLAFDRINDFEKKSWIDKTDLLEDLIQNHIDDSKYYIVFDELDEDYRFFETETERKQYVYLITSLFKAVQDIKSVFKEKENIICPIIFLRDDIYSFIQDADKNKWRDFCIFIEWDEHKIKRMLAYRISKAQETDILSFYPAWNTLFMRQDVLMGTRNKKRQDIFTYMTNSTHLRPRDYIKYIQVCALKTKNDGFQKITSRTVKEVDKGFSNYLKDEIIDEIHVQLPDIVNIFSIISQIRKPMFSIREFKNNYMYFYDKKTVKEANIDFVLETLFNFSVIGNTPKNRPMGFFRYKNSEARFNFNENIIVHRGLFKALQIL